MKASPLRDGRSGRSRRLRWKGGCSFERALVDDGEGAATDGEERHWSLTMVAARLEIDAVLLAQCRREAADFLRLGFSKEARRNVKESER
ncbi:hypothetical protein OPV22_011354 [Ensete ventricosum]|uniref:Uncharacterized protein n=1 Tax=Ensete ventricosum TaxID=4639 RepID=A0AAV8RIW0_ENSVE|nr:hypothetical protein OPV22_011354 [Ensete ventricosum]